MAGAVYHLRSRDYKSFIPSPFPLAEGTRLVLLFFLDEGQPVCFLTFTTQQKIPDQYGPCTLRDGILCDIDKPIHDPQSPMI